jgi:hypothetical protein
MLKSTWKRTLTDKQAGRPHLIRGLEFLDDKRWTCMDKSLLA